MIKALAFWVALAAALTFVSAEKEGRQFGIVDVIKFENGVCDGGTLNGTCFTAEECSSKGGKSSKSCAEGFGVCCTFELSCGGSSTSNNTYITQTSTTTRPNSSPICEYTICPQASSIARMRFDFTTLVIAAQVAATIKPVATAGAVITHTGSMGHCTTDMLQISGSGSSATPVICGTLTGDHAIVDSDGVTCSMVKFLLSSTSTSRQWNIWVTQYTAGDLDSTRAGPSGCLQYFTGTTGFVKSFTHPSLATSGSTGVTTASQMHLADQDYSICIRRESGKSIICYNVISPSTVSTTDVTIQGTFGLSVSPNKSAGQAGANTKCTTDFLEFVALETSTTGVPTTTGVYRTCGRIFGTEAATGHDTLCTNQTPFTIKVSFDTTEVATSTATKKATVNEGNAIPSGTLGFGLLYIQS